MNAHGNTHTIALSILALRLMSEGVPAVIVEMPSTGRGVKALLDRNQPRRILISIALAAQSEAVIAFVKQVAELPEESRPRIIAGGYAVKSGLITEIAGAELMADIASL